jgi:hypothetical protein
MISFSSPLSVDQILDTIRDWLRATGRKPEHLKRIEDGFAHHTYEYDQEGTWIHIRDDNHIDPGKFSVSLMLIKEDANKP